MFPLLFDRCLGRSHFVEELFEKWQFDHQEAMRAHDLEELCGECLEITRLYKHGYRALVDQLFQNGAEDLAASHRTEDLF